MTRSLDWAKRDAAVVWHGFTQMSCFLDNSPVMVDSAEGREVIDVDGRRYFDAISSVWATTLGHRVPELDAALVDQVSKVAHTTMLGNGNRVVVELAEALAEVVPVSSPHFLFASDGSSAVEQALKIAFQMWANCGVEGRTSYLCFGDAYHGDTVGSMSLGDGGFGTDLFDLLRFPVLRAPSFGTPGWAEVATRMIEANASQLAAVVIEPLVQGAGGMRLAEPVETAQVAAACEMAGVLLVCDEVATGFGRTGTLFASEQCGIEPDLFCLGKGITGGYLPMSVTVASGAVFDAFLGPDLSERTFYHGHTYGGNALAAAVALRHLELLRQGEVMDNVTERSEQLSTLLSDRLLPHPAVGEVRQRGLMAGVELRPPSEGLLWGRKVSAAAVRRRVLLRPLGDVIALVPPLTITEDEVEMIVEVLIEAIDEVCGRQT
jgi:adenosylmethionine---8-amino-7-oxononanoate aminotransferase